MLNFAGVGYWTYYYIKKCRLWTFWDPWMLDITNIATGMAKSSYFSDLQLGQSRCPSLIKFNFYDLDFSSISSRLYFIYDSFWRGPAWYSKHYIALIFWCFKGLKFWYSWDDWVRTCLSIYGTWLCCWFDDRNWNQQVWVHLKIKKFCI